MSDCPGCGSHPLQNCVPGCDGEKIVPPACEHRFVFLRHEKTNTQAWGALRKFYRGDVFFCERCLEERRRNERVKEDYEPPEWFYL